MRLLRRSGKHLVPPSLDVSADIYIYIYVNDVEL